MNLKRMQLIYITRHQTTSVRITQNEENYFIILDVMAVEQTWATSIGRQKKQK